MTTTTMSDETKGGDGAAEVEKEMAEMALDDGGESTTAPAAAPAPTPATAPAIVPDTAPVLNRAYYYKQCRAEKRRGDALDIVLLNQMKPLMDRVEQLEKKVSELEHDMSGAPPLTRQHATEDDPPIPLSPEAAAIASAIQNTEHTQVVPGQENMFMAQVE